MIALAFFLVVTSAALHVTWNMLSKASTDKLTFNVAFNVVSVIAVAPPALYFLVHSPPPTDALWLLAGTVCFHSLYFFALSATYERADLSISYPIMRGSGVLFLTLGGTLLLGEYMSPPAIVSVCGIVAGIVLGQGGPQLPHLRALLRGQGRSALPGLWSALLTGAAIAGATLWDKVAVGRIHPVIYYELATIAVTCVLVPYVLVRRRSAFVQQIRSAPGRIVAAGLISPLSYLLVLTAYTLSPVSYVGPAREVSVVFAVLIGTLVLREPPSPPRLLGAALVFAGALGLALAP